MGYATQHLQYLPFGETFVDQQNGYDARYTFSAKELDDETQYSYFGARYYDSDLSVWLSVDAMSDNTPGVSPYAYCINNPVIIFDPDGNDWFVDEVTGDVHYNSRLGKNDAAQVGENYKWLGANDMFGYSESDMKSAISDHRGPVSKLAEYVSCGLPYTDGGNQTSYDEAHFKGENAEKFMGAMGYKKVPTQAIEHTTEFQTTTEVGMGRSIDYTSYNVTRILEKYSYVPNGAYEVNTFDLTQRDYKQTSPYSSQSVARVSINYSTNSNYSNDRTIRNSVRAVGYGCHSDYLIENYTYASYPRNIDMLNKYILKH
jgi:RHS repeat-associated protein